MSPWRSKARRVTIALSLVTALAIVSFALASAFAALRVRQVEKRWAGSFGSWEEMARHYPSRTTNRSAMTLERLAAPMGIELAPKSAYGSDRPSPQAETEFVAVRDEMDEYLDRQLERPQRAIDPAPEAVAVYLRAHRKEIEAVREQLLEGPAPLWELRLEKRSEVTLPGLLGHLHLQKVLLTDALLRTRAGDHETALADLEASWKLNAAIRDDPLLITQLAAIAVARRQAGALRLLDEVPAYWSDRLVEHDARRSLLKALSFEGRVWIRLDEAQEFRDAPELQQKLFWAAVRPLFRLGLADVSERYRRRLENLAELDAPCDRDLRNTQADLNPIVPAWNVVGRAVAFNFTGLPGRSSRLELDIELTAKLLELRRARQENDGQWPEVLPGLSRSVACPGDHWSYESNPDGTMSIAFSRELLWPEAQDVVLPTRYTESL